MTWQATVGWWWHMATAPDIIRSSDIHGVSGVPPGRPRAKIPEFVALASEGFSCPESPMQPACEEGRLFSAVQCWLIRYERRTVEMEQHPVVGEVIRALVRSCGRIHPMSSVDPSSWLCSERRTSQADVFVGLWRHAPSLLTLGEKCEWGMGGAPCSRGIPAKFADF